MYVHDGPVPSQIQISGPEPSDVICNHIARFRRIFLVMVTIWKTLGNYLDYDRYMECLDWRCADTRCDSTQRVHGLSPSPS